MQIDVHNVLHNYDSVLCLQTDVHHNRERHAKLIICPDTVRVTFSIIAGIRKIEKPKCCHVVM